MHEKLWSSRCLQKRKSKTLLQISQHIKIYTRQLGIGSPNNSRDRGMVMNNKDISKRKREGKPSRKCKKPHTSIYKISGSFLVLPSSSLLSFFVWTISSPHSHPVFLWPKNPDLTHHVHSFASHHPLVILIYPWKWKNERLDKNRRRWRRRQCQVQIPKGNEIGRSTVCRENKGALYIDRIPTKGCRKSGPKVGMSP